jgi:hypothetical protein
MEGELRAKTNRSAHCPWCHGPVIIDDRLINGYLRRVAMCLAESTCGWFCLLNPVRPAELVRVELTASE